MTKEAGWLTVAEFCVMFAFFVAYTDNLSLKLVLLVLGGAVTAFAMWKVLK